MSTPKISVILPVHNEARRLEKAISKIINKIERVDPNYQFIIAEDGSIDGTDKLASTLAKESPRIDFLHGATRLGRGRALTRAMHLVRGDIAIYMDTDLATDLEAIGKAVSLIQQGADIAIGSRYLKDSRIKRSFLRNALSRVFNAFVISILKSPFSDHQIGFKAFRLHSVLPLLDQIHANSWFWDTELLVKANRLGCKIIEFPVIWNESGESKVKIITDSILMLVEIFRLWRELRQCQSKAGSGL